MNTMLKLQDVYALPGTPIEMSWGIRSVWFPEVETYQECIDSDAAAEIKAEGRLVVKCIFERNFDGDRFADMHTIFFDEKPVMVVRDGGRGGRDYRDRKITDPMAYLQLCHYIRQKMNVDVNDDDVASPDELVYAEELFNFYGGTDFASELGYTCEPRAEGFQILGEASRFIKGCKPEYAFVEAREGIEMPLYVRRRGYVVKRVRSLTAEELASNPNIAAGALSDEFTQFWFYEPCERPVDAIVVAI